MEQSDKPAASMNAAGWTGANGDVWAQEWQRTDRSFTGLSIVLDRLVRDAMQGRCMDVADIGCGAGGTAIAAAQTNPQARITAIDISPALIAVAQARAGSAPNIRFIAAPVETGIIDAGPFDLIMSRHGVMFFDDPLDVFKRLRAATKAGGQLVFSCFQAVQPNVWARELMDVVGEAAPSTTGYRPGPFGFADKAFVTTLLQDAGWNDVHATPIDFKYIAGTGNDPVADAVYFFSRIGPAARALKTAPPARREEVNAQLTALCAARLQGGQVDFPAAAWIWSARNP